MSFKSVISVVLFVLLLIVAFQNMDPVVLRMLFWEASAPQLLILMSVFLVGLLVGLMLGRKPGKPERSRKANTGSGSSMAERKGE